MSVLPPAEFFDWIDRESGKRGWNDHRLGKAAGLSHGYMPNLRAGKKIGYEACAKIADALKVPRPVVYVKAGLDRGQGEYDFEHPLMREIVRELPGLDDDGLRLLRDQIELVLKPRFSRSGVKRDGNTNTSGE